MSRLWSRFGVRVISMVLLLVGVAGGVYLSQDRETQQQGASAQLALQADRAELQVLREQQSAHAAAVAPQREAEAEAAAKAADAAKAAAVRAEKAKVVVTRKQERTPAAGAPAGSQPSGGGTTPDAGPIPESCNQYSGNRAIGCAVLVEQGLGMDQMACLDKLFTKESGWNHRASNPSSGAYGIAQSLPPEKMASVGADWRDNPRTQIIWGLGYMKGRYGSPCGAWSFSQNNGWY